MAGSLQLKASFGNILFTIHHSGEVMYMSVRIVVFLQYIVP